MPKTPKRPDIQGWAVTDEPFRYGGEDRAAIYARDPNGPANEYVAVFPTTDDPASDEELLERLEMHVLRRQKARGDEGAEARLVRHEGLMQANEAYRRALRGITPGPGDATLKG